MDRIVILAFDGLDRDEAESYRANEILQIQHGKLSIEKLLSEGGRPGGATNEVFGGFLTGSPLQDYVNLVSPFGHFKTLKGKMKTIFDLCDSVAVDVPCWNWNEMYQYLTRQFHIVLVDKNLKLPRKTEIYNYLMTKKYDTIMEVIEAKIPLTMIYFWFPDLIGHMYKGGFPIEEVYAYASWFTKQIKMATHGDDVLYLIMSDHGSKNGTHDENGGLWSLSEPLLDRNIIEVHEWYGLIEDWVKKLP